MFVLLVVVGKGIVFMGAWVWLRPWFSLLYAPVHINEFLFMFLAVGMRGEPAFFAVEWCFLDVYLLQVLNVTLDPQGTLTHVIPVYVVKGSLLRSFIFLKPTGCRVEAILDTPSKLLLATIADPVLARPRNWLFLLLLGCFESLRLGEVAYFGRASLLERVVLVAFAFDQAKTLLPHLLLVIFLQSSHPLRFCLIFTEDFLSSLSYFLLYTAIVISYSHLVVSRARHVLLWQLFRVNLL